MTTSQQKIRYLSRFITIFFIALILCALGVIIAFIVLILTPAKIVAEIPKDKNPLYRYFVLGKRGQNTDWVNKYDNFVTGKLGEVRFAEDDLNGWLVSGLQYGKIQRYEKYGIFINAQEPNLRIANNQFQLYVPIKLKILKSEFNLTLVKQGKFEKVGNRFELIPARVYISSARLPSFIWKLLTPPSVDFFANFFKSEKDADALIKAWDSLTDVRIEGNVLVLERK